MKMITRNWNYISLTTAWYVFVLITSPNFLFSQTPNFRITHYTTNDGLSQNSVYCIFQDSKGFMWFGTRDGLNKFDGYTFTHYKPRPFDEKSISHNIIRYLLEDKDGMIWIATGGGGLCRYDRFKNDFISLRHNPNNPQSLSDNYLIFLYLDDSRKLWIGTLGGGLNMLDIPLAEKRMRANPRLPLDSVFTFINYRHYPNNTNSLGSDVVNWVVQDRLGNFLIMTNLVLDHFNPVAREWTHYYGSPIGSTIRAIPDPEKIGKSGSLSRYFLKDKIGDIWLLFGFNLFRYDAANRTFDKHNFMSGAILCEDWSSNFWFGDNFKLYVIPKKTIADKNREQDKLPKPILTSDGIHYGSVDSFGSVWIGTDEGIYKFVRSYSGFNHISRSSDVNEQSQFNIRALHEDQAGNIWLGTVNNSLRILDRESGLIASPKKGPVPTNPILGERIVNVILHDSSDNYWIGTRAGVYFSQRQSYSIKRLLYGVKDIGSSIYGNIFSLLIDHHGRIWFGGTKGNNSVLLKYNKASNTFDSTAFPLNEVRQKSGTGVWKFLEDSKHRIWIGTTNGVFLVEEPSEKITHFFYKADDASSLSHDETWTIFEDHSGNIWIGTMGGGLNLWHQKTENFTHFTHDNGLAGNIVFGILEDELSNLWISTNNGISKFNPRTNVFRNYFTPEIRSVGQFNNNACLKTKDGFMLFGGRNGILRFHPDSIREDRSHAPIVITSFSVLGKEIRNEIGHGEEISIPYKDNYFSMEFASLDYRDSPKLRYAYKLEGINNNWMNAGTQRFCSYSNLSPGDYLFRIKATNSDGVWNEKGISILIHIVPPIYLTSWFKWSVGVLMFLLIVGLMYWRMDFVHRKELNRRRLIESELQALRLQMNPHFIFNSLNAIQNFVINSDAEKATEYLSKFARLMRMILENSKQQAILLKDEIEFLSLYLEIESVRFEERFDYTIQVDPALSGDVGIPSMLLQPYIENAIRHGLLHKTSRGKLTVKLALLDDTIVASIIDDGIGRKKAMEIKERQGYSYKAFGMEITHDRLKILNTFRKKEMRLNVIDLYDEHGEPNGTQIEISIPV